MAPSRRSPKNFTQAFTLIELLVVIAIIAILTAILLPVFASVREGSRQGVAISNMKDIQQKMEQFKLDNHKYPDVLFGYAYPGSTMLNGLTMAQNAGVAAVYFPGLYPAYIKDPNEFTDPNNPLDSNLPPAQQVTTPLDVYLVAPCNAMNDAGLSGAASGCTAAKAGQVIGTKRTFYKLDAFDSGPQVIGGNQVDMNTYLPRYQLAHEGTVCPSGSTPSYCDPTVIFNTAQDAADYKRQLRWQNPPADTVVTLTSYHVKFADKVLIMFQSGAVKKLKAEDYQLKEDVTGQPSRFWRYPAQ